jgi:anti-sigma factor RsiW
VDVPAELAQDFAAYRDGILTLEIVASDAKEVELYLEQHLDFDARVFDLAMMEYLPVGGRVHEAGGAPSALFVYRGPDGRILVCQMFRGRREELPAAGERRVNDGIEFQVYERDGKTVVAWQEGEVVCVLVSDIQREQVIQLAFAKAVKV